MSVDKLFSIEKASKPPSLISSPIETNGYFSRLKEWKNIVKKIKNKKGLIWCLPVKLVKTALCRKKMIGMTVDNR